MRRLAPLPVLALLLLGVVGLVSLGASSAADDPAALFALLGTALCALGCFAASPAAVDAPAAVVVPGRRARLAPTGARHHHPDTAGRPRPRAPGATPAA